MDLPPIRCGGCRTCCLGDTVALKLQDENGHPLDNPADYKTVKVGAEFILKKGKDGNCVYLGKRGCQIHGRAPYRCRQLDCRKWVLGIAELPGGERKAYELSIGPHVRRVLDEGEARLASLGVEIRNAPDKPAASSHLAATSTPV